MEKTQEGLLLHRAYSFAALYHEGQKRKGSQVPYIAHPAEVAQILAGEGAAAAVICAGLLHDTLEEGCSEDKNLSWEERKEHTVQMLKSEISMDVKLITCADKLSNLRSICLDYRELGDALWSRFRRGKEKQRWYYRALGEAMAPLESRWKLVGEYRQLVREVFPEEK